MQRYDVRELGRSDRAHLRVDQAGHVAVVEPAEWAVHTAAPV
jgi:hypothetical protein